MDDNEIYEGILTSVDCLLLSTGKILSGTFIHIVEKV